MLVVRTSKRRADSLGQLIGAEQTVGFDHFALAMNPFGLHGVKPRALLGQQTSDDPHPFLLALFQSPVAPTDPAANLAAYVPTGVVPDQHQHSLAQSLKLLAAPLQKARGYPAQRAAVHKAQPSLLELGHVQPVARDSLRIGIIFFHRLFPQAQWLAGAVACQLRQSCASSAASPCSTSTRPQSRAPNRPYPPPGTSAGRAAFFSFVQGIGRGDPVLGSLPTYPYTRQGGSDSLPAYPLLCESLLKTHLCGHLHRPQTAFLAELPGAPMKHLTQSLGPLLIEGPIDGVGAVRTPSQPLLEALLIKLVDGIARGLGIAAKIVGDLVGILSIGAGEQDLATT